MQNFFSYPVILDELSQFEKKYHLQATSEDLFFLTEVLKVPAVKSFTAEIMVKLKHKEHRLEVWGKIKAELELQSVVSLEYFRKVYEPDFSVVYDTVMTYKEQKALVDDIDADVPDIIEGGKIDLGQISIEQIALVLEDYPRKEGEVFEFHAEFEEEITDKPNPFSILTKLKK